MPANSHPMSFSQESIWLNDQFRDGPSRYQESWAYRLTGRIDTAALEAALTEIVRRHEVLRSRLDLHEGAPRQTVLPARPVRLIRRVARPGRLAEALREALDLAAPPLLRAHLLAAEPADRPTEAVLLVVLHHAAMDGESLNVLGHELEHLYRAAVEGRPGRLPAVRQAGPLARLQHREERLRGELDLAFWRDNLRGAPRESALPGDRPRPSALSHRGAEVTFAVDEQTTAGVRDLARRLHTTPYVVLLTALTALTYRLSGQRDLVLGTPVSRRDDPGTDGMIACLAEVMPLRRDVDPGESFASAVAATQEVVLDALEHGNVRFSRVVAELGVPRTPSQFPLFQIVFAAEAEEPVPLSLPGVGAERLYPHNGTAKYDIFLSLVPRQGAFRGTLEYSTDLYDHDTATRLTERYLTLLAGAVRHPDRQVGHLAVLPERELAFIRSSWETPTTAVSRSSLHEFVAERARLDPDVPAVVHGRTTLTYRQLDEASGRLAARLAGDGHGGGRIAVCLDRSAAQAVAVLAVSKAGAASVPVDPAYPAERVAFMLRDSGATAVITEPAVAARAALPAGVPRIPPHADGPAATELPSPRAGDLAYVLYTSGSTGRPKGVAMPHAPLVGLIEWQGRRSLRRTGARTLQYASLSFDVAFQELYSTWASGGTVVMVDEGARADPERLSDTLVEQRVERMFLPFVALQQLAVYARAEQRRFPDLREVVTAGEQLFVTDAIQDFFARCCDASLENQYGPTETHVVTAERLTGPPATWPEQPSIGRPVDGARAYVLDDQLRPAPVGVPGELYLGGRAPARGYLGRPELTAERFLPDLWDAGDGGARRRMYRSGDRARLLADGRLQFLGRGDDQVKIRGFRIELGEVESALKAIDGVLDAVVVATAAAAGAAPRLIAAYLPSPTRPVMPEDLRAALGRRLPAFMVPSFFLALERFPRTPSGKVDRRAVARIQAGPPPSPGSRRPATARERRIAEQVAAVLGVAEMAADDDFFRRGGDSLRAVRLALALRQEFGVKVPMNAVFTAPTVAGLAALVGGSSAPGRGRVPDEDLELPGDIRPAERISRVSPDPAAVLLTGATGFVGAFLLRALLHSTSARVHCLVRGHDDAHAARRLRDALAAYGVAEPPGERVSVVRGDLGLPRLGLSDQDYKRLARGVDAVYHCGAAVNLAQAYGQSRAPNVLGTVEVLRLAASHRTVPVHHISTTGVFSGPAVAGRTLAEDEPLTGQDGLIHGYTQSKWAAERLIAEARRRGLPVSVYRPTRVAGDSATGAGQTADYLWLLLKGCAQAGAAPRLRAAFDLVPVDYVARATVVLSRSAGAAGGTFHLAGERLVPLPTAVGALRGAGHRIEELPFGQWAERIGACPGNAVFPLLATMADDEQDTDQEGSVRFSAAATRALLEPAGITCPAVDAELFRRYLDHFTAAGFLPAADERCS
ncbi:amino acid adenylation domain-containing protein [Actinoplanes sp. NPDC048988]|uniref:non-ribosomal peptide synthetase n=1 Tax=Actinoplanes sp. NPDC048988 TaxID=3363901 RepID=UPI00371E0543